jgi:hypothetical protein
MAVVALCRWLLQSSGGGGGGDRKAKGCVRWLFAHQAQAAIAWRLVTSHKSTHTQCAWGHTQCHTQLLHLFEPTLASQSKRKKTQNPRLIVPNS